MLKLGVRLSDGVGAENQFLRESPNTRQLVAILQLQASLERAGKKIPVLHTIQLLDASIRGQLLSGLRK